MIDLRHFISIVVALALLNEGIYSEKFKKVVNFHYDFEKMTRGKFGFLFITFHLDILETSIYGI